MKYIITESRLEKTITNYLDELFDVDEIKTINPLEYDDDTDEEYEDTNRIEFYIGDYFEDDGTCFRWHGCEYFDPDSPAQDICPEVIIEHTYSAKLDGYFGDAWKEPFKKWFVENFELPIKTVGFM